jgi:tetratricopeptide (TPR) repeat protein
MDNTGLAILEFLNGIHTLDSSGRYEEAVNYYDKVLAIEPYHMGALYNKGVALDSLGK